MSKPLRVLCCRSVLLSISQSVHQLLKDTIKMIGADDFFDIQANKIVGQNGSEFIYCGLSNVNNIRSLQAIDRLWVEEADMVEADKWEVLLPTCRKHGVRYYIVYNPTYEQADTHKRFNTSNYYGDDNLIIEMNYLDNPWCPDVIKEEAERMKERDFELFQHVYMGKTKKLADDIIFRKVLKESFVPDFAAWDGPYYGMDLGLGGADPTVLLRFWTNDNQIYVEEEAYKSKVEIPDLASHCDTVSGSRDHIIRVDSATPSYISHLRREGFNAIGVVKGAGSVEMGYSYLKGYNRIIVHPRCEHTYNELVNAKWKKNLAGDILPIIAPSSADHAIDALRYGLQPLIQRGALTVAPPPQSTPINPQRPDPMPYRKR